MINYFKKLFLISFLATLPLYAMENEKFIQKNKDQALLDAITTGDNNNFTSQDWKNIINCLENGANINLLINKRVTPLILAIMYHNQELFYYLLKKGVRVNSCNKYGRTALHYMLSLLDEHPYPKRFDIQMFKDLLKHGANISAQTTKTKKTPLFFIAKDGNADLVKLLIQYQADINQFSGKYKPLWFAIKNNNLETAKALLHHNASLTQIDQHDCTIFHMMAYYNKSKEFFKTVLTHARFNSISAQKIITSNKSIDVSILEFLLILKKSIKPAIPTELHFRILSMLPNEYFQDPDSLLCKKLLNCGYKNPSILAHVNRHVQCLNEILSIKNNTGSTALECLQYQISPLSIIQIAPLINQNNLKKQLTVFHKNFPYTNPQENNLINEIYKNYAKLADKNKKLQLNL